MNNFANHILPKNVKHLFVESKTLSTIIHDLFHECSRVQTIEVVYIIDYVLERPRIVRKSCVWIHNDVSHLDPPIFGRL